MQLQGAGGTGKSKLIEGWTQLLEKIDRSHLLRKVAVQGSAAENIGGDTIAHLCCAGAKENLETSKRTALTDRLRKRLRERWLGTRFLIIDESSVVSKPLLAVLSTRMAVGMTCEPKSNNTYPPFGGASVLLVGDVLQKGPFDRSMALWSKQKKGVASHEPSTGLADAEIEDLNIQDLAMWPLSRQKQAAAALKKLREKKESEAKRQRERKKTKHVNAVRGALLYGLFTDVAFLTTQFRQTGILKEITANMRQNTWDPSHWPHIEKRITSSHNQLLDPSGKFGMACLVTTHNAVRECCNIRRTWIHAEATNQRIFVASATDHITT
jgi:hypothetical protein